MWLPVSLAATTGLHDILRGLHDILLTTLPPILPSVLPALRLLQVLPAVRLRLLQVLPALRLLQRPLALPLLHLVAVTLSQIL